eukprot:SAG11_NODE_18018_length_502_cov_0.786600_1_plen_72_part_10
MPSTQNLLDTIGSDVAQTSEEIETKLDAQANELMKAMKTHDGELRDKQALQRTARIEAHMRKAMHRIKTKLL